MCTEANFSMPAIRVVFYIKQAIEIYGKPLEIRVDNEPEFLSNLFVNFCDTEGISINYTAPGEPTQNGYVERFNKTFREDYNEYHPHKSLGRKSPNEVLREFTKGLAPL